MAGSAVQAQAQPAAEVSAAWLEVVIPARNEAARLPRGLRVLCSKLAALPGPVGVIVVDSGSTDETSEIVRRWPAGPVPVRLIRCDSRGKGMAVRAGLLATQAAFVGFCDADMATDLAALDVSISLLKAGHQVVVGSRAHPASSVAARDKLLRRLGAAAFRGAARMVVPGMGDTQCGFKFFSGPLARAAARSMVATGFAFDVELLARCRQLGAEPIETPVIWHDVPGSTFSVWRHSVSAFWEVALIAWQLRRAPIGIATIPGTAWPGGWPRLAIGSGGIAAAALAMGAGQPAAAVGLGAALAGGIAGPAAVTAHAGAGVAVAGFTACAEAAVCVPIETSQNVTELG